VHGQRGNVGRPGLPGLLRFTPNSRVILAIG